jgi:Subtilase family
MTGDNSGPAGADAAASRGTSAMTVHTVPALGEFGIKEGHGGHTGPVGADTVSALDVHGSKKGHDVSGGLAGADAPTSRGATVMSVHTLPAPGEMRLAQDEDEAKGSGTKEGHAGDIGAVPVVVFAPPPPWPATTGRRPVVAVLDSGVEPHPWLAGSPADPVVWHASDSEFGWSEQPEPTPEGFLGIGVPPGSFRGHATFVAGVIRQTAPAARILSVPVMTADGAVNSDQSWRALTWLSTLVGSGEADRFVDVICLAYGYEKEEQADDTQTSNLRDVLKTLAGQGVLIVASAGNRGEMTPMTYPAAFALEADPPVISVGATNPDETNTAYYSNYGEWVTYRAIGSGVISTFMAYNGDQTPLAVLEKIYPHAIGHNMDPDDFRFGFARWSGTSFSAARIAGLLARELSSAPDLGDLSSAAAGRRAKAALAAIEANRWQTQP